MATPVLKFTMKIEHLNGDLDQSFKSKTVDIGQAVPGGQKLIQLIGTSPEALTIGDVATLGLMYVQNLDPSNYVDFGPDVAGTVALGTRVLPGEVWPFRAIPGTTYKAQAHSAPCKCVVGIFEV